jgi:hypothetical protein
LDNGPARAKKICDEYSSKGEGYYIGFESRRGKLVVPVAIVGLSKPEISSLKEIGRCPREECEQYYTENLASSKLLQKASPEDLVKVEIIDPCPWEKSPSFPLEYILSGIFYTLTVPAVAGTRLPSYLRI